MSTDTIGTTVFDYVVVGAGMAGAAAVRGIRAEDPTGSIALLGSEPDAPYVRPALSKALWREPDTTTVDTIQLPGPDLPGVRFHASTTVTALDTATRTVGLQGGGVIGYHRLVLATGGRPRTAGLTPGPRIIAFHDLADYRALRAFTDRGARVVVAGAGYIGTELAAAVSATDASVTYVHSRPAVGARWFPREISEHLDRVFSAHGVQLVPGARVESATDTGDGVRVTLSDGRTVTGDVLVTGLGQDPATELARSAGLTVEDAGVVVDDHWRTSDPHVYAAGDIAAVPDRVFGRRAIPHEDAAVTGGEAAGRNAAGADVTDPHLPFFYSDLYEDGYEALGRLSSSLETLIDWKSRPSGATGASEAVVYYLDADRVLQGVLLWNVWGDDDHDTKGLAAQLLADRSPRSAQDLVGRI